MNVPTAGSSVCPRWNSPPDGKHEWPGQSALPPPWPNSKSTQFGADCKVRRKPSRAPSKSVGVEKDPSPTALRSPLSPRERVEDLNFMMIQSPLPEGEGGPQGGG